MSVTASAPGSSANVGPGFDVLALAFDIPCRVTVEQSDEWFVTSTTTPDASGAEGLLRQTASAAGASGTWTVEIDSEIPIARGLGSSAALIVAAAAAMRKAAGLDDSLDAVFAAGTLVEGHPDNVAASVWGGGVVVGPLGTVRHLDVHPSLRILIAVPDVELLTAEARKATKERVPTAVASRTAARLAFLIEGLRTGDPELLAEAGGDELHELRRAFLSQRTVRLMATARAAGAAHAAWSGAGPATIVIATEDEVARVRSALAERLDLEGGSLLEPAIATDGLVIGS